MKTSKEFFEKVKTDEAFAKELGGKINEKVKAGEKDLAVITQVAAEYGYTVTEDELQELVEEKSAELSEEELGKVAGGTTPVCLFTGFLVITMTIDTIIG